MKIINSLILALCFSAALPCQTSFQYLDTNYVGNFSYLLLILDDSDPFGDEEFLISERIHQIRAQGSYRLEDDRSCVRYVMYDMGNTPESLTSEGLVIRKFDLCEGKDSTIYAQYPIPEKRKLISKEEFQFLQDSLRADHPRLKVLWDKHQYIPGVIQLDSLDFESSEDISFMKFNREPSFFESFGPDSIMLFQELSFELLYDFGAKIGDTIIITTFYENYWSNLWVGPEYQSIDTFALRLRAAYDVNCLRDGDCFSSMYQRPPPSGQVFEYTYVGLNELVANYRSSTQLGYYYFFPFFQQTVIRLSTYGTYLTACNSFGPNPQFDWCELPNAGFINACQYLCPQDTTSVDTTSSDTTTSVHLITQETIQSSMYLYPNPVDDLLYFGISSTDATEKIRKVTLYDLSGRRVFDQNYASTLRRDNLDLSHLKKGVYFLQVTTPSRVYRKRFVKME